MSKNRNYEGKYKEDRVTNPVYKEDSTRGKSLLINPQTFKGDALVQVWIDSRILATLSNWLDTNGSYTRFMSEVVKDTLKATVEMLVNQGEVEFVNDTAEARNLLKIKYGVNLNPRGKGMKNVMHNQLLSNKNKEIHGSLVVNKEPLGTGNNSVDVPAGFRTTDDEYEKIQRKIREEDERELEDNKRKELANAIKAKRERELLATKSNLEQSSMIKEGMSEEELNEHIRVNDKEIVARENAPIDVEGMMKMQEERIAAQAKSV